MITIKEEEGVANGEKQLRKELGILDVTAITAGIVIGAGSPLYPLGIRMYGSDSMGGVLGIRCSLRNGGRQV